MNLNHIEAAKLRRSSTSQPLFAAPEVNLRVVHEAKATARCFKRSLIDAFAPVFFPVKLCYAKYRYGSQLEDWAGSLSVGYRFSDAWVQARFLKTAGNLAGKRVLLPGANFNSSEVRQWFSRPAGQLHVLDIIDWGPSFASAHGELHHMCKADLFFHHGTLDALPLPDDSMDIIETRAVLEHVGNMKETAAETARVLRADGVALHTFGPLYFTHGGDHCIAAYGSDHGFDHLLLEDPDYRLKLLDEAAFERFGNAASDARYWAIQGIFSYLRPAEYLEAFAPHFEISLVVGTISEAALAYRKRHPEVWRKLRGSGLAESDLLIGSMTLLLRKKR